ncbi:MAG: hypothetical protein Q8862_10210 [Bacteroidota bacterium]|nr:hypothetical protein [Bacteroidota bacterium]
MKLFHFSTLLKVAKRLNAIVYPDSSNFGRNWKMFPNKGYSNKLIYDALTGQAPCMIARLGATELYCLTNYIGVKKPFKSYKGFIKGLTPPWWWESSMIHQMQEWSGFFPAKIDKLEQFCELMIKEMPLVDILGTWLKEERFFEDQLLNAKKVILEDLEPFFASSPWTKALEGKNVLVVHPFAESIESQYANRELLFENGLLPEFELQTIKAVQSIAGEKTSYQDWFEALDWMKAEISKKDFEVCILGCGAYGFPLAAYVKRIGKKAIHLGGVTQLLFGIKGKRWESETIYPYSNLFNEHWIRPGENEKPQNAIIVEGACYW